MNTMDFQEATAQRILHIFKDLGHRRVLLADEVGLGKTFVAQRVIQLVKEWHKNENDDFFKVVYICSNANIADQNIEKLGVCNKMNISESRLSMQHLYITLTNNEICKKSHENEMPECIIPLTPSTSFHLTNSQGTANERALMFCLLKRMPSLSDMIGALSVFMSCEVNSDNWYSTTVYYDNKIIEAGEEYIKDMLNKLEKQISINSIETLRTLLTNNPRQKSKEKMRVINELRRTFALISIDMLDPDLVIMDEFQRFSDLLQTDENEISEQRMLTQKFFDDNRNNTKILLLSATPYKPYSTLEEINDDGKDEHYQDFMNVMDFLFIKKDDAKDFQLKWQKYSAALKKTNVKDIFPLQKAKDEAEQTLYSVMCRTERFNSGIIKDYSETGVQVLPEDILSYAEGQKLLEILAEKGFILGNMPLEYVKSSPYLLTFMDKYELKKNIVSDLKKTGISNFKSDSLLIRKRNLNNYKPLYQNNGKLKYLHDIVFGQRHEKKTHLLLWVPSSHPYYKAGGIFESDETKSFSKIILFSSWEMVPRMISCMMSYYAELYTFGEIKKLRSNKDNKEKEPYSNLHYLPKLNANGKAKNRYGENRLRNGNPLEYPCKTLANLYNPEEYFGTKLPEIRKSLKVKINEIIQNNPQIKTYSTSRRGSANNILILMKVLDSVASDDEINDVFIQDNALKILTDIAIASPAVCAFRQSHDVNDAEKTAKAIVSIFNKPESAAIIDLLYTKKSDDDYYENVLDYCVIGNLQAVLDEYAHMLQKDKIGKHIEDAILGTSTLKIDTDETLTVDDKPVFMRNHFAIPFVDKTITDKAVARSSNIRKAFNSPFRPFILSSTSIGQEGLDFHWYARKIVHWNLPSNPVDIEQREGRINRYKCLAVRRNVAKLYGEYYKWEDMFKIAKENLKSSYSDMVPYWCLPVNDLTDEQRQKLEYIERIVPLYPLSRDTFKYKRLIYVLSFYRMTLGQPRQEELIHLLKDMKLNDDDLKSLIIDLCPYNKNC